MLNITAPAMLTYVNIYFEQVLFLSMLLLTLGHIFRAYVIQTSLKLMPGFYTSWVSASWWYFKIKGESLVQNSQSICY